MNGRNSLLPEIRPATDADLPLVLQLIRDLARYERLTHTLQVDEQRLGELMFGPRAIAGVLLASVDAHVVGFVLFYESLSTFLGCRGLFIEDLFVRPSHRQQGIGLALLSAAAEEAKHRECGILEWRALDWNTTAIEFYGRLGAKPLHGWTTFRLKLADFAGRT